MLLLVVIAYSIRRRQRAASFFRLCAPSAPDGTYSSVGVLILIWTVGKKISSKFCRSGRLLLPARYRQEEKPQGGGDEPD